MQKLETVDTEANFLSIFKHEIDMRMNFDKHHKRATNGGQLVGHPTENHAHGDVYGPYNAPATFFPWWHFGRGIWIDYSRRLPHFVSDFTDGFWQREVKHKETRRVVKSQCASFWKVIRGALFVGL